MRTKNQEPQQTRNDPEEHLPEVIFGAERLLVPFPFLLYHDRCPCAPRWDIGRNFSSLGAASLFCAGVGARRWKYLLGWTTVGVASPALLAGSERRARVYLQFSDIC
jgi:hypothetical protein